MTAARSLKIVTFSIVMTMMSVFVMPGAASADPGGSPKAIYRCYSPNYQGSFVVHTLGRCELGVITIYSTYDDKTHGQIQVRDGQPYTNSLTFSEFAHVVLRLVAGQVARKLWTTAKKYWDQGQDPDLPVDLPLG